MTMVLRRVHVKVQRSVQWKVEKMAVWKGKHWVAMTETFLVEC